MRDGHMLNRSQAIEAAGFTSASQWQRHARKLGIQGHRQPGANHRRKFYTPAEVKRMRRSLERVRGRNLRRTRRPCPVYGVPLHQHARCPCCDILMGPGHEEQGPGPLCVGCRPPEEVREPRSHIPGPAVHRGRLAPQIQSLLEATE